jgi:quinol monooxygenase YgiN
MHIVTYVDAQRNSTNEALALLQRYGNATGAENGSLGTFLLQETSRPNRFVIVEAWRDEPSFQAHETAPHTTEFRTRLATIHNSPSDQRVHFAFSVGNEGATPQPDPGMMYVVTHVDVPPPRREETELLLKSLADGSRSDDGNVRYDVFQQTSRPNHFTVFAVWADEKAFASHDSQPHTRQFREALGPMLGAPYDERLYHVPAGSLTWDLDRKQSF